MNTELWNLVEAWQARQRFGVTQSALAREVGVSRSALSQWKSGKARPTPEKLRSLSSVTGVSYRVLLDALLMDMGYLEKENADASQERQTQAPPMNQAAGSAATHHDVEDTPTPPTEDEYGLAAKHAERERPFDSQEEE